MKRAPASLFLALALLSLLGSVSIPASAQKVVFAEADTSTGPVIVSSQSLVATPRPQPTEAPRRRAAMDILGRPEDLPPDFDNDDADESAEEEDEDADVGSRTPTIVGGKRVPARLRKHLARVFIETFSGILIACSGSVISPTYVLSAAHCFVDPGAIDVSRSYVLVAERTTKSKYFRSPSNKIFMRNVFVHRRYRDDSSFANDIALVQLESDIPPRFLSPIALENPPTRSGSKLQAAGYGARGSGESVPRRVRRTDVLFQRWSVCDEELGFSGANNRRREFCYTSLDFPDKGRTGTCFGDSGGPILKREHGQFQQIGITSYFYGDRCNSAGAVMVAMNLSSYKKMIRRKVRRNRNRGWRRL
ncbi:unnamed protein product [Agarophyton chilense]